VHNVLSEQAVDGNANENIQMEWQAKEWQLAK